MNKVIAALVLICLMAGCTTEYPPNDTRYDIAVKQVDGVWDTITTLLPANAGLYIHASDGTYSLRCCNGRLVAYPATIQYKVLKQKLELDTTSTKVEFNEKP